MEQLCFASALIACKDAKRRIARTGWNGAGMFVYRVPAASYPAQTGAAKGFFGENAMVPYRAYYALKDATGQVATWTPSSTDLDAEDWVILPEEDEIQLGLMFEADAQKSRRAA